MKTKVFRTINGQIEEIEMEVGVISRIKAHQELTNSLAYLMVNNLLNTEIAKTLREGIKELEESFKEDGLDKYDLRAQYLTL